MDGGSAAFRDVAQADAKVAVPTDQHRIARLDDVGTRRLHGSSASGRDRYGHRVLGVEHLSQHLADVIHDLEKCGV